MESKLIDSSVYISLFVLADSNHHLAKTLFENIGECRILIPYLIYQEILTVLHNKYSLRLAQKFDTWVHEDERFILLGPEIADEIVFWRTHNTHRISYIDTVAVYASLKYKAELLSFDQDMMKLYKQLLHSN